MIIAFLIAIIGIIPVVLAIGVIKIYKGSDLAFALLLYMICISLWQLDIGVLYLKGLLPEELILWLFKLFRIGPTFMVPIVFYLSYILLNKHISNIKNQWPYRFLYTIFNRKALIIFLIWSSIVFVLNLTNLGIIGLKEVQIFNTTTSFYFPEYGPFHYIYMIHSTSFVIFVGFPYIISRQIHNIYLKDFLRIFSLCSFLMFLSGYLNFIPVTGALFSSLGVIIFSVIIVFSFSLFS
ncbi:hypothetical protein [Sutcliffiella halmapala]|uniref:hypothetical protein n=1 Tax=Sutcliffiella halmapala TaxID=79882 RepID=UPI000994CFFC|nr:hypothetical protein [Sutcliffiella halmapala]